MVHGTFPHTSQRPPLARTWLSEIATVFNDVIPAPFDLHAIRCNQTEQSRSVKLFGPDDGRYVQYMTSWKLVDRFSEVVV